MTQLPRLLDATLDDLVNGLEKGHFTSVELVKAYLERIQEVNGTLRAVTELDRDVLHHAALLDEERSRGKIRGPLHGIPVLVKNNIYAENMDNTAGSSLLVGARLSEDSRVVKDLKSHGALILGKTNLSQWANWRTRDFSLTGWTVDGGQTLAAYHPNQSPGGSSSGSGVAVDLGLAWAALGTETDGSILDPAFRNSIVGIKPTVGLTPRTGVVPISEHFDTVGPMACTVRDAAQLLQLIVGRDSRDKYTSNRPFGTPDYMHHCDLPYSFIGTRIGVPWNVIDQALEKKSWMDPEIAAFKVALSMLEEAGATVGGTDFTVTEKELREVEKEVLDADFPVNLANYLSDLESNPSDIHNLADVRAQTQKNPEEGWPERDTEIWDAVLDCKGGEQTDAEEAYKRLQELSNQGGPMGVIKKYTLTAIAMPTSLTQHWAAVGGGPAITVPLGQYPDSTPVLYKENRPDLVDIGPGVPFGLCFLGERWSESRLIQVGHGFEQMTRARDKVKRIIEPSAELAKIIALRGGDAEATERSE